MSPAGTAPAVHEHAIAQTAAARPHLAFLDGLRGLAALYVVLHHAYLEPNWWSDGGGLPAGLARWVRWLSAGHYAVAVFIVLSGYCLMLPLASSGRTAFRDGLGGFFRRRARRILPPYYAALALSLLLIACVPPMQRPAGVRWDFALPAFRPGILVSHALLVHNLRPDVWMYKIDTPMWTVATEWQIYFVFALLLLPVWRRAGMVAAVAAAFALGMAPHWLLRGYLDPASPWYLGLFALGMAAAAATFGRAPGDRGAAKLLRRAPCGPLALVLAGAGGLLALRFKGWSELHMYAGDILIGAAAACLIVRLALDAADGRPASRAMRLLEHPWVVRLGVFSYSLYLIHFPLFAALDIPLRAAGLSPAARFGLLLAAGVPLILGLSYAFHLAFERPFLSSARRAR